MYDQSKLSELIRFARVDAGSTVIDVYPGDGDWTRLFSDIVGSEGRVYSFVPAEGAQFEDAQPVLSKLRPGIPPPRPQAVQTNQATSDYLAGEAPHLGYRNMGRRPVETVMSFVSQEG